MTRALRTAREDSGVRSLPRARRSEPGRRDAAALGVVAQVREATKPRARLATVLGALLGGFVPTATYVVAHRELDASKPIYAQPGTLLVLGGLLYSARTVFAWGKLAFGEGSKALGFVVLLEGVLLASRTSWLSVAALLYLAAINGVATGCRLSLGDRP